MEFPITIIFGRRKKILNVRRIYRDEHKEHYLVDDDNVPLIFERTFSVDLHKALIPSARWRLLEPRILFGKVKSDIIQALKSHVEQENE